MSKRSCKKCNAYIPWSIKINGKRRQLRNRKFCLKCSPFGSRNTKPDDPARPSRTKQNVPYAARSEEWKEAFRARLYWKATNRKQKLIELHSGKCAICGYNKCVRAMAFHHRDPSTKSFDLSKKEIQTKPWEVVLKEASKCDLLCVRCHMEVEEQLSLSRYLKYESDYAHIPL